MAKTLFIFDLDYTLYDVNNKGEIKYVNPKLFKSMNGDKIIFSNAKYQHCINHINQMSIINDIKCIRSSDIYGGGLKPAPNVYYNLTKFCDIQNKYKTIYFFDDKIENLYIGSLFGWIPIWINKNHKKLTINYDYLKYFIPSNLCSKKIMTDITSKNSWIKHKFNNINEALTYIKNINNK